MLRTTCLIKEEGTLVECDVHWKTKFGYAITFDEIDENQNEITVDYVNIKQLKKIRVDVTLI